VDSTTEGKLKEDKKPVVNGTEEGNADTPQKLIQAFGKENEQSDFDWDKWYGEGSDVLHFSVRKAEQVNDTGLPTNHTS
jgi:hypothetical protein